MRRTIQYGVMLLATFFLPGGALADSRGDLRKGKEKVGICGGCHGVNGNSENPSFPRLAGQNAAYIVKQVHDFQMFIRTNNEIMSAMGSLVASDDDLWDIAAFFSKQKIAGKPLAPVDQVLAAKGEAIYLNGKPDEGVYACVNCHGERGRGLSPEDSAFPVIGGQHRDYLIKQIKDFRSKVRNNDPDNMMHNIAKFLTDEDIDAISNYLSGLIVDEIKIGK